MAVLRSTTDGVVVIQPSLEPAPIGRIVVGGKDVGWVHYDVSGPQANVDIQYDLSPLDRADEYAARVVALLVHHLACAARIARQRCASIATMRDRWRLLRESVSQNWCGRFRRLRIPMLG